MIVKIELTPEQLVLLTNFVSSYRNIVHDDPTAPTDDNRWGIDGDHHTVLPIKFVKVLRVKGGDIGSGEKLQAEIEITESAECYLRRGNVTRKTRHVPRWYFIELFSKTLGLFPENAQGTEEEGK